MSWIKIRQNEGDTANKDIIDKDVHENNAPDKGRNDMEEVLVLSVSLIY